MPTIRTVERDGVTILVFDFSRTVTREEALARIAEAAGAAADFGPGIRTLTDVRDAYVDAEVVQALGALARANAPHVAASAVVGAHGMRDEIRQLVAGLSQRTFESFDDAGAAMDWLAAQAS